MAKPKKKPKLPRGLWSRSPVQRAHSDKGYNRRAAKQAARKEAEGGA